MLILDGTIHVDIKEFLQRIKTDTDIRNIITYQEWNAAHNVSHLHCDNNNPQGIVYMRIAPPIAFTRIQKRNLPEELSLTLNELEKIYRHQEQLFIERKNLSSHLCDLPVLVLNGNIDFQTDFAQFYNHLFYIKKFLKDLKEKEDKARGIHVEKPQRRCC